ncbi:MAG: N-acetylmuramoyl-L-alanine amidase [Paracoccaceae bacterium]|jgi:N-acetylmuramoyl-L-alanine amidase
MGLAQEEYSVLSRFIPNGSYARDVVFSGTEIRIQHTQGVPFRIYTLDAPKRLIVEFNSVIFAGFEEAMFSRSQSITGVRAGALKSGWSRMVFDLARPMLVERAGVTVAPETAQAELIIRLTKTNDDRFAADAKKMVAKQTVVTTTGNTSNADQFVIVLDPGHGGIDPGAVVGDAQEADLMLSLAREIRDILRKSDGVQVHLTRDEDVFVSLEDRVSAAHALSADVFLSLHADIVTDGQAFGTTVYTLSETASDEATAKLALRHDRGEILFGVDLRGADDEVSGILIDLARLETIPQSKELAGAVVDAVLMEFGRVNSRPIRHANFSVLKAPDIPSILVEAGFMSSSQDLENLKSPEWRTRFSRALVAGILDWYLSDAALAPLRRQ